MAEDPRDDELPPPADEPDPFHTHLLACNHCARNPFDLCFVGKQLLEQVIVSGDVRL